MKRFSRSLNVCSLLALALVASADMTVHCNVKDGDKISGITHFRLTVDSEAAISKVEYYFNDRIKGTDDSTPYEFDLDTLVEPEGPVNVRFLIQASNGEAKNFSLKLTIDNEVSKGSAFWLTKAESALIAGKWDDAIRASRIALKSDKKSTKAKIYLARAYFGNRTYDLAQKNVEDVLAMDEKNAGALDLLSAIRLQQAFHPKNTGRGGELSAAAIQDALIGAATARAQVYENELKEIGAPTLQNRLHLADVAIRAGRYSVVVDALRDAVNIDPKNSPLQNRYIYALLRAGRFRDADAAAQHYQKFGQPDAEGLGLISNMYDRGGDDVNAAEFMKQAIANDPNGLGVLSFQAQAAYQANRIKDFRKIAKRMAGLADQMPEVAYFQSNALYKEGEYEDSRRYYEQAVLAEPVLYDVYIQAAQQYLQNALQFQKDDKSKLPPYYRNLARANFMAALAAKPESFEAYAGLSVLSTFENKGEDALKYGRLAVKTGPEYGGGHYVLAMALTNRDKVLTNAIQGAKNAATKATQSGLPEEAKAQLAKVMTYSNEQAKIRDEIEAATRGFKNADKKNLGGAAIPDVDTALSYLIRFGRSPLFILTRP